MSHTITLPDELYRALETYAAERQQTPEEALASLVRDIQPQGAGAAPVAPTGDQQTAGTPDAEDNAEYGDPWEGFRGKYTADVPDLMLNHDKYLAEAYLDTHDGDE